MDYMHYQRMPHIHGDLEPAFVVPPHEPCCPDEKEECMCITSGEVEKWNEAADMLSALSGITPEDLDNVASAVSALTSADFWNAAYDGLFDEKDGSAKIWNGTYTTVFTNSGIWNSASQIPTITANINSLSGDVAALSANKQDKIYFDNSPVDGSLSGDGKAGSPYGVKGWQTYANLRNIVNDIRDHILVGQDPSGVSGYIFDGASGLLKNYGERIYDAEQHLKTDDKNIIDLSAMAMAASAYAKELADKTPEYIADERTIHRSVASGEPIAQGVGNTYVFSLKGLPDEINADIAYGVSAYNMAKQLMNMQLAGFLWHAPYPKKQADVANLNRKDIIYVSYED